MKRIIPFIMLLLISTTASAQLFKPKENKPADSKYLAGEVPIENNRVVFRQNIDAPGLSSSQIMQIAQTWYKERFVEPTVISAKEIKNDGSHTFEAKVEEYIVFKKKLFVLNRARIYYYLTLNAEDGKCEFIMSRITYWHDDENPDGGTRYNAEELITDEKAIDAEKRDKLVKTPGKFRIKTIDLKNTLFTELTNRLKSK
ncbi:MAG: DUF4468 domain-containing protein [Bacteroidaceae bacterium]|nr:DUF4468 domain-containing protein [Bacteroidaceae bacterium]